jgi:hypothetical protein
MVKYFVNGTIVPKEQEPFVKPVKLNDNRNLKQAGIIMNGERQIAYELVSDVQVLETMLEFAGVRN